MWWKTNDCRAGTICKGRNAEVLCQANRRVSDTTTVSVSSAAHKGADGRSVAMEMVHRGDYVIPPLLDEPNLNEPPPQTLPAAVCRPDDAMGEGRRAILNCDNSIAASIILALAAATIQSPVAGANLRFQVVVHPDLKGSQIRRQTLSSIFLKELGRWGSGLPARSVYQSMRSPVRALFTEQVLSRPLDGTQFYWADMIRKGVAPPPVKESDPEVIEYVARTNGAIGYVSLGVAVPGSVETLSVID